MSDRLVGLPGGVPLIGQQAQQQLPQPTMRVQMPNGQPAQMVVVAVGIMDPSVIEAIAQRTADVLEERRTAAPPSCAVAECELGIPHTHGGE